MWNWLLTLQSGVLAVVAIAVTVLLLRDVHPTRRQILLATLIVPLLVLAATATWSLNAGERTESHTELASEIPQLDLPGEGFVSSSRCVSCHPSEYESWHDSFHRTMTQPATPESVIPPIDGTISLASFGRPYQLWRDGDEFFVDMVDPEWEAQLIATGGNPDAVAQPPRVARRIVMTTGSHHMQTYWVAGTDDGTLYNVPFIWLNDDERWVPREEVFMRPPGASPMRSTWHDNCIECHSTAGESMHDRATGTYEPRAAELGIACEACHGPAEEHVRANLDPLRRYRLRLADEPDPTIVNPARLDATAASHVCGQCHGINIFKAKAFADGVRYRAGESLYETRMPLRLSDSKMTEDEREHWPTLERHIARQRPTYVEELLWPDGMVRVSGREHNAMIESACYLGGELSCLTCHTMHDGDPDDQLVPNRTPDHACLACHDTYRDDIEEHTHHPLGSAGSLCINCHMPHTVYGLLKGIRSHLIDSPSAQATVDTGRPNACNLCHLDQTLRWTADHLSTWYGQDEVALETNYETVALAPLWALTGDANQRALMAWHMGWEPAREASGRDWLALYLGHLLADPYSAVRYIADRSLQQLPHFGDFEYDYLANADTRSGARRRALGHWRNTAGRLDRTGSRILLSDDGDFDAARLTALSRLRNDRRVDLRE